MALIHTTFRSKMRFGRLSLLQYLLSANSVCISYFYFVYCIFLYAAFLCFLLCMFLLYITVLLPVGVIKDGKVASRVRGSRSLRFQVATLGKRSHASASVTMQYDSKPVKGR